jgi:hypothetical protein
LTYQQRYDTIHSSANGLLTNNKESNEMNLMRSTTFAIQQILQSVLTLSVLGGKEDIKLLEEIIEKQSALDEDNQVLCRNMALIPILQEIIKEIRMNNKHSIQ